MARANLSFSAVRSGDTTLLQFIVNVPLAQHDFVSAGIQTQAHGASARTDCTTAPVTGRGVAWHLGAVANDTGTPNTTTSAIATLEVRSDFGEHGVDVFESPSLQSWRVRSAGSVGALAGRRFFGPPVTGGFALVSTGDAPGIPVYRWNLPVAVSDSHGQALVTSLNPYQKNWLTIKPEEVPLQYRIQSNELSAIPRGRGGVLVDFSIVKEQSALVLLELPNGQAMPAGARVQVVSTAEVAQVGLRGEVYLQNVPDRTELDVSFRGKRCRLNVHRPTTTDPQPRLGPYICTLRSTP